MKKIYIPQGGGRDFWLRIPMNNESAGRHLCMDDVDENEMHVWLESGYGGCWTLVWEKDGSQRDGIAAKVPASQLGYGTYSVVMAGKFVNGDYFRTKRQLFIRLVDREDQADAEPTMYNEEQAYWAGPAVLSEMLSRDGLNTYELWILQGNEGTMEQFLAFHGFTLNDYMVHWNHLSVDVQTKIQRGEEKGIEVMGDYSATTTYDVNDLVFDPTTNSSYISKHASNTGNALTDTDHWMKTMDGSDVLRAIEDADDATDAANTAAATAESAAAGAVTTITEALTGYFTCGASTDKGGLQTKVVDNDHDYIKPSYGGAMKIRMYQVNTYVPTTGNPVKLKIGSETAAELLYNREPVTPDNSWEKNEVISVYYDGSVYQASNAQGGGGKAEKIKYDNSQSGLAAENVQDGLDEFGEVNKRLNIPISTTAVSMPSTTDGVMIDLTKNPAEWKEQPLRKLYFIPYTYKEGDYLVFYANNNYESSVAFLTSSNHVAETAVDWAGNQSSWYAVAAGENNADNPKEIPSDCTYICFNGYYSTTNFTPSSVQIVNKQFVSDYAVEVNDHADNNTLLIDTLASECQDKDIEYSYNTEAFVGQWTSGSIGTTAAIRAHLKLPTIGFNKLKLVIPSDYYTQLSYVDSDNVLISTRILEWQNGTITVDIDGQYDIMLNIKYKSAGTTKITDNMLAGVMWGVTLYNDEGYEPAAPYSNLVASVGGDHIIGRNEFVQGSNNEYGEIIKSNYRCITYQLYDVDANTVVTVNNNEQAHVMLTFDSNGNIESTTGWITANSSFTYTFTSAKKVQFVVSWNGSTSTAIVPDQVAVGITIHYKGRLGVLEESMGDSATTKANDSFCRFNKKISVYNPYKDHPQNQFKGQMHCHTTNSDGALAPASVVAKYVDAGFDFMTITDHNYITPNPSPNADIVWMGNSYEDTWNAAGHQHMNVWNCTEVINKVNIYATTNTPQMLVNHYVKDGDSVLSYNHPEYPAVYASDTTLAGLPVGISFVEIFNATIQTYIGEVSSLPTEANYAEMVTYNGTRYINTSTTKASPNWQATTAEANPDGNLDRGFRIMLDSGKKVFCDAVDDFHRGDEMVGVGYMKVFANSRTRQSIWNGLLMGASYASTGVSLNDVSFVDGVFRLDIADGASAVTTFYGYNNEVLGTSNGATAIYEVTGDEKYVRAMVEIDGKKAWTQPVWIIAVGEQYEF